MKILKNPYLEKGLSDRFDVFRKDVDYSKKKIGSREKNPGIFISLLNTTHNFGKLFIFRDVTAKSKKNPQYNFKSMRPNLRTQNLEMPKIIWINRENKNRIKTFKNLDITTK